VKKIIDTTMTRVYYKTYARDNIIENPDKTTLEIYSDGSVFRNEGRKSN
jgi:hypothetical protein